MTGMVRIFEPVSGNGFIQGVDGKEDAFYQGDIEGNAFEFKILLPGWRVSFGIDNGRARKLCPPISRNRLKIYDNEVRFGVDGRGMADLRIDQHGRIYVTNCGLVRPSLEVEGEMRVFFGGRAHLRGFDFTLPETDAERSFQLLDPQKHTRNPRPENRYEQVADGSYVVIVERSGETRVWKMGRRIQGDGLHWLVISRRFQYTYDLSGRLTETSILGQTPISGKKRDNDSFVPAIIEGLKLLDVTIHADAETVGK